MTKRIVYLHRGDTVELRFVSGLYPATATEWKLDGRSWSLRLYDVSPYRIHIADPAISVFFGFDDRATQMLPKESK